MHIPQMRSGPRHNLPSFQACWSAIALTFKRRAPAVVLLFPAGGVAIARHARGPIGNRAGSLLVPHRQGSPRAQPHLLWGRPIWGISGAEQRT